MAAPSLAIDFGTSRTKVAYFDDDKREPRLIEIGQEIRCIVPSTFYVPIDGHGQRLVGDAAQEQCDADPQGVVVGLKKEIHRLGRKHFGPGRSSVGRVELASDMFSMIREFCFQEYFHQEVTDCTLTVPVTFVEQQRECIIKAAELGGFRRVKVVEEPVSAAQAWLVQSGEKFGDRVIVCDVGGGTTDFALLQYARKRFEQVEEIPTAGLSIGGNDVDEGVFEHSLADQNGDFDHDLIFRNKPGFLIKIRRLRELLSRNMSQEFEAKVDSTTMRIQRSVLEQCTSEFIERITQEMRRFLTRCRQVGDIAKSPILLVGGASRLAGLKEKLESIAVGGVYLWNQSDYATALGAVETPTPSQKQANPPPTQADFGSYQDASRPSPTSPKTTDDGKARVIAVSQIREMIGDGRAEEALDMVSKILLKFPSTKAFDLWMQAAATVPSSSIALKSARELHLSRGGDPWSKAILTCALADSNRRSEALEHLSDLLCHNSETDPQLLAEIKWAHFKVMKKSDPEYRKTFDWLLKHKPNNPLLLAWYADELIDENPGRAKELYEQALQNDLHSLHAMVGLTAQRTKSSTDIDAKTSIMREGLQSLERISRDHFAVRVLRSLYRFWTGDFREGIREIDLALQDSRLLSDDEVAAEVVMIRSYLHTAMNDTQAARRDVDEAIRLYPDCLEALFARGSYCQEEGQFQKAISSYDRGLVLAPNSWEGHIGRAWALVGLTEFAKAAREFENAANLRPADPDSLAAATYGIIFEYLGHETKEVSALSGYLHLYPNISQEILAKALGSWNNGRLPAGDQTVLLVFDATSFGGLDCGFLISEASLVVKGCQNIATTILRLSQVGNCFTNNSGITVSGPRSETCVPMPDGMIWNGNTMRMLVRTILSKLGQLHRRLELLRADQ